jgi:hypothetical protein
MNIITTRYYPAEYLHNILHTLEIWTSFINDNKNFSFIKFGDGEFYCMMNMQGTNCDQHLYSKELGDKLIEAWNHFSVSNIKHVYIADWGDQPGSFGTPQNIIPAKNINNPVFVFQEYLFNQRKTHNFHLVNFEILLQNTLTDQKYNFFKSLKESNRKKVFVGPERLSEVISFLNIDSYIQVPLPNSFAKYDLILDNCKQRADNNSIFIFSSGMPTKALISDLLKYNNNITCLDAGSSFDALFVGGTREGQLDTTTVKNYYKDLL